MPACYIDGVALQPSCRAGVVLASADMVQPSEGNILVPIRAVPSERLLNPLGRGADGVAQLSLAKRPLFLQTRHHLLHHFAKLALTTPRHPLGKPRQYRLP